MRFMCHCIEETILDFLPTVGKDAAMRALLCVLYTEVEDEDFSSDTLDWFADMLNRLGDYSNVFERYSIFGLC